MTIDDIIAELKTSYDVKLKACQISDESMTHRVLESGLAKAPVFDAIALHLA